MGIYTGIYTHQPLYLNRAAQNIQNFNNRPNNHKVMSTKGLFFKTNNSRKSGIFMLT